MRYPEELVTPMRKELTDIGFDELKTAQDVEGFLQNQKGTALIVFNSICGCAAGGARPGVALSLQNEKKPEQLVTIFAGQDAEAADAMRAHFSELPPSSPCAIITQNGEFFEYIPRHMIEGHTPLQIAESLIQVYNRFEAKAA